MLAGLHRVNRGFANRDIFTDDEEEYMLMNI
jgi:hypothetical protein